MLFSTVEDLRAEAVDQLHAATAIYTKGPVVEGLLRRIGWPKREGRILDPSAGDGSFLIGALDLMDFAPSDFASVGRVSGMEIHPGAVAEARDRISEYLVRRGWSNEGAETAARDMIVEGDFLCDSPVAGEFSMIAGNPPYLRVTNLPTYFREVYGKIVPAYAQGDILHAFLDRCSEILPANGVIALVTSDRWLINLTTAELRSKLGRTLGLSHIERLDVESAFYRPKRRVKGSLPRIHPIEVVLEFTGGRTQPISPDVLLSGGGHADFSMTLADVADVRLAPWIGGKNVFVVDQATAARLAPFATLSPAVDTEDIDRDRDVLTAPSRFVIRTTKAEEPTGLLKEHLLAGFGTLPAKCKDRFERNGIYWLPAEPINLPLSGVRFLIPRIARRIRVIELPEGVVPTDHNVQIAVPSHGLAPEMLKEILLSPECDAYVRTVAQRLENGFFSITTGFLRRMPVPDRFRGAIEPQRVREAA